MERFKKKPPQGAEVEPELAEQNDLASEIWQQYEKGQQYQAKFNLFNRIEDNYRFYEGDQWSYNGQRLQTNGDKYPVFNIIEPVVNYKVATICMNMVAITLTPQGCQDQQERQAALDACTALTKRIEANWEIYKLDSLIWDYALDAAIAQAAFVYFTKDGEPQQVDNTNIILADEQEPDIQHQPYIIIVERKFASDIRAIGQANGLSEDELGLILPDSDTERQVGDMAKEEVRDKPTDGKCTSLFKMWRDEQGVVNFCRAVKNVVYQPPQRVASIKDEQQVSALTMYPLACLVWKPRKGSARGRSEVEALIPNQIEINKNLARRVFASKTSAFPRLVYDATMIEQPQNLEVVGAPIELTGSVKAIDDIIKDISPQPIGNDVQALSEELISRTQNLVNAGDAALGDVNPERASGAAIVAARDQSQIPLNRQKQSLKQFVEDIARVWLDQLVAYHPNGLEVAYEDEDGAVVNQAIPPQLLTNLQVKIRVDVSSANPISKLAADQALEALFTAGHISFEEYVEALDDASNAPKARLQEIIEKRKAAAEQGGQDTLPGMMDAAGGGPEPAAAAAAVPGAGGGVAGQALEKLLSGAVSG